MKIAVIILNYNSSDDCRKCVGFLKRQEGVDLEILLVDNASRPEESRAVDVLCRKESLTFIPSVENRGYNAGNNIGLRYAAGKGYEYVMIANPDMEFPDIHYVARLSQELSAHGDVVVIGSDIVTPEGVHQNPKFRGKEDWKNCFKWVGDLIIRRKSKDNVPEWVDRPDESRECRSLNGCCLLLRMDFLKDINFFDDRTFLYGEEPILGRQVELHDKKMYYYADVAAVHDHKKSREGSSAFCRKHWRNSQLIYIRYYSGQPWYGKLVAEFSCRIYFLLLGVFHSVRNFR